MLVADPETRGHARAEALDHDVRGGREIEQHLLAVVGLEIERERALVGQQPEKIALVSSLLIGPTQRM